ncbi:MAG: ABC transporter permease, partial [Pyrinomonadaceae bacterium]
ANVANLLLARSASRQKEIAIRTALGASRPRVIRQLLTESLLLSLVGGTLGLLLALWGVDLLVAASPADIPRLSEISLDSRVLTFTLAVSALTGVLFGLAPAVHASRLDLNESLKEGGRGATEGRVRVRVRGALIVSEVALSLVLLVGAGLLIRSFWSLLNTDPGYSTDRVLTMYVALSGTKYPEGRQQAEFFRQALERARALPGVEAAGTTSLLPLAGNDVVINFNVEGRPRNAPGEDTVARYQVVSPDYFRAMKIPVRRGRDFGERDREDAPHVIVVNESFVKSYFGGEEPLGRRILIGDPEDNEPPREIVGVVGDVRHGGLDDETFPAYYVSHMQTPASDMWLVARAAADDPGALAPAVR